MEDFEPVFVRREQLSQGVGTLRASAAEIETLAYTLAGSIDTVLVADLIRLAAELERASDRLHEQAPRPT